MINARSYIHVFGCIFDAGNEADSRQAYEACRVLIAEAAKAGFGEYRAHLDNMDLVQDTYRSGDHAYRRFVERIEDAGRPERDPLARQAGNLARGVPVRGLSVRSVSGHCARWR